MGGDMVAESWFSLWRRKGISEPEKGVIGILAFEVTSLMSKLINLWHCLSDGEFIRLREEIVNSAGLQKLVIGDENHLLDLALNEIIENFGIVARHVARLGKRCVDPTYHRFEQFINSPAQKRADWFGWEYKMKKMEKKVKKMEKFVAHTLQLSEELEVLAEREQTLRRMKANPADRVKLYEYQQKVLWQRQEVKNLRDTSPWNRTYDYIVRLLMRSLFTILHRIQHVFGINQLTSENECRRIQSDCLPRSHSFSALVHSPIYPSDNSLRFNLSGPLGRVAEKHRLKNSSTLPRKQPQLKSKRFSHVGPLRGCMSNSVDSPIWPSCEPLNVGSARFSMKNTDKTKEIHFSNGIYKKLSLIKSKRGLLMGPPSTLGHAALALHYANVIKLIEKLALSPHLIGFDVRDDLYKMLTVNIRADLRARLKSYGKSLAFSMYDASLAADWNAAIGEILDWLAPLAHNMIKWHSERNFEKENVVSGSNVLLVQTLYYANQMKTEAAIVEILVGLNYICRISVELKRSASSETNGIRAHAVHQLEMDDMA
ncbi:hypothetical protein ACFE04_002926 [Oxalis oulophora]